MAHEIELEKMLHWAGRAGKAERRVAELEAQVKELANENYQLCGLASDELGIGAEAVRSTAASRRPELKTMAQRQVAQVEALSIDDFKYEGDGL